MSGLTHYRDHVEQGLSRLLWQFKDKPRIAAWTRSYLRQVQLLEDAAWDVLIKRWIDYAEGVQLDVIGKIVGELRAGRVDAIYKTFIHARVRINRSQGSTGDVLDVFQIISTTPAIFAEYAPAALFLELLQIPEVDPALIYKSLNDAKAGGVKLALIAPTTDTVPALARSWDEADDEDNAVGDVNFFRSTTGSVQISPTRKLVDASATFDAGLVGSFVVIVDSANPDSVGQRGEITGFEDATHLLVDFPPAVLGETDTLAYYIEDVSFGLLADAVTVRGSIVPRPGPPKVFTVTPAFGTDAGGTEVAVTGQHFEHITSVRLDPLTNGPTNVIDLVIASKTQLTFKTPPRTPGQSIVSKLWITSLRGVGTKRGAFLYQKPPTFHIDEVSPRSGPRDGGTEITISGQLFTDVVAAVLVFSWGDEVPLIDVVVVDDATITATVSSGHPSSGPMALRLRKDDGTSIDFANAWAWELSTITVSSIAPASSNAGGIPVVLTGTLFTSSVDVQFRRASEAFSQSVGYTIDDDEHISLTMPPLADLAIDPGPVDVVVVGGDDQSLATATFEYVALVAVYVNPNEAPTGTDVEVHGTSLDTVTSITVMATPAAFAVVSPELLIVTIPGAVGPTAIVLSNPFGEVASVEVFVL